MQFKNFWETTAPVVDYTDTTPWPSQVDVAIIGGGFTGLAAGRALAQRGASVAILEAEQIGWGASSRNGGMVLTGLKLGMETLIARYGLPLARRLFAASLDAIDCVEQIVADEQIECNFERSGHLEVACKPAHFAAFERSAELLQREYNHEVKILETGAVKSEIDSDIFFGGLLDERSASINPARFVLGLGQSAAKAGACLFSRAAVLSIDRRSSGFVLKTARGELRAAQVLVATGGYSTPATPSLWKRIVPIGSYIIATAPMPSDLAQRLIPRRRMIFDSLNFLHYFRITPDNRLLFGGRAAFKPESDASIQESAAILQRDMLAVYPYLHDVAIEYAWGGTLDFSHDWMPHTGSLDGLYYSAGYAGHGVALATYLGTLTALALIGEMVDNPFAEIPLPQAPLGLHSFVRPLLPAAAAWLKFKDWLL